MSTPTLPNPDTLYEPGSPTNITAFEPEKRTRRKRRKRMRKKRKFRGIPAGVVFYTTFAIMAYGLFKGFDLGWVAAQKRVLIQSFLFFCILLGGAVIFIDEKWSFSWSHSMRRSYQVRTNLTKGEIITLYALTISGILIFVLRMGEYVQWYMR